MLHSDDGRHQYVDFVAMNLKGIVPKELSNAVICLHDLSLRVLIPAHYDNGCIFCEHHLKIVLRGLMVHTTSCLVFILKGLRSLHHVSFHNEVFSLSLIILNLEKVVPIDLQGLRVVGVNPSEHKPNLIDPLCVVNDVETQLVQHVEVDHLRVEVRPELNVVVRTLLYLLIEFAVEALKSDDNRNVKLREVPPIKRSLSGSLTTLAVLIN